ncbi:hypothetical protein [Lacticaseibacillus sp. 53-4]|uniref:hypothetical protein n=1 Tax=Lacticaseibacillus sp. 53-4 TaxID=2799575 RepID=UPI001943A597|nr:hypothetical protein [Lacticaseibacillus sp. 53-4]
MDKEKLKVLLTLDADGVVIGYQKEFWNGQKWQVGFDDTDAIELSQSEIDSIVVGATTYANGKLATDEAKAAEVVAAAERPAPSADQQILATVMLRVAKLEAGA